MATSVSSRRSLEASPQSLTSSDIGSSAWSNPHSSLLEEEDDNEHLITNGLRGTRDGPSSNESGFTNPSSFGSMIAILNLNQSPPIPQLDPNTNLDSNRSNSAFDQGTSLARLAWLEMDAEVEAMRVSEPSMEWKCRPVTSSSVATTSISNCPTYSCARCGTTLALQDELISKAFSGRDGKAFLFFSILNAKVGQKEDRQLLTGLHTVADLSCSTCQRSVGWCYLRAFEASQRYKEGKFILERAAVHKINNWKLGNVA